MEEKEQPNYYAILTAEVRYAKDLTSLQKLLFAEITALSNKTGECWASNKYFADLFGKYDTYISRIINDMAKKGYISIEIDTSDNSKRYIRVIQKYNQGYKKGKGGVIKKYKHNNTSINNKYNILETKVSGEINHLIKLFEPINPSYKTLFGNNTQRKCLERLLKEHGLEKMEFVIKRLPDIVTQPYAPRITTPLKLEQKLGELMLFISQERAKNGNKFAKMD